MNTYEFWMVAIAALSAGLFAACGDDGAASISAGTIEGTVELEGAETAGGVDVTITGEQRATETDEEGSFRFEDVRAGTRELEFERQGYVTANRDVEVADGETRTLELTLQQINEPPRIEGITINPERLEPEGTATVEVTAVDPNPDELSYTFEASGDFSVESSDGNRATVAAPAAFDARARLTVTVEDPDGTSDSDQLLLETIDNSRPLISGISAAPTTLTPGGSATVTASANDPDGDELTFSWTAPDDWTVDDPSAREIQVTAPDENGASAVLELEVTDERGLSANGEFRLSTAANDGPTISSITAAPQTAQRAGTISLDVSASDPNGDMLGYSWSAPSGWSFDDSSIQSPELTAPDQPGASANIEVTVTDEEGLTARGSVVVSTAANRTPVVNNVSADQTTLSRQGTTDVTASATDPNGDELTYSWSLGNGNWSFSGSGATITLTAPDSANSSTKVTVTVSDDVGGSTSASVVVTTAPNEKPLISSLFARSNPVARNGSTEAVVQASDPNGDTLSYSWSLDNNDWSFTGSGSTITLNAPDKPSSSVGVTVTVTDDLGASRSTTTQVSTVPNDVPQITSFPPSSDPTAGREDYTYQAAVSDPDDSSFTWSLTTTPSNSATVDSTGLVTWKVPRSAPGTSYTFELTVSDGNDSVKQSFTVDPMAFDMQTDGPFEIIQIGIAPDARSPAFGDFDGDGLDDLAAEPGDGELSYLLTSQGFGNEQVVQWPGSAPFDSCLLSESVDLDGDGDLDVVVGCDEDGSGSQNLTLATWINDIDQNQQTGSFSTGTGFNSGVSADIRDLGTGNVDGANGMDVVVADSAETIHVVTNDGSGGLTFSQSVSPSDPAAAASGYSIERVAVDDFDSDPELEVLALESFDDGSAPQSQLAVYDINSSGTLQSTRSNSTILNDEPDKWDVGDLDGDGDLDVAVKTDGFPVAVETFLNDGSGSFSSGDSISSGVLSNLSSNRGVSIGDVDRDGDLDVVVGTGGTGTIHVAFGDGNGNLDSLNEITPSLIGGDEYEEVFVGDFNGDSALDVFAYDYGRAVLYR